MYLRAASNVGTKIDLVGLAACQAQAHRSQAPVAAIGSIQHLAQGATLFTEGDPATSVYQVVSGTLRLYKALPDGRRQITGFLSAGHLLALAPTEVHPYSTEAITPVSVRRYPRPWFEKLLDEVPGLARRLFAASSDELRAAQDQMLLLGRKTAEERVASFLLMLADLHGGAQAESVVQLPMSRGDVADYLGLTIETVSRTLAKMKQQKIITLTSPTRIELRNRARLAELATGEVTVH